MKTIFHLLLILLLVGSAGSIYFALYRNELTIFLFILLIIYILFFARKIYITKSLIIVYILFIVMTGINYLFAINGQSSNTYFFFILVISIAVLFMTILPYIDFFNNFIKILNIIKIHALLSFIFYFLISNSLSYIEIDAGKEYLTFHQIFFYLEDAKLSIFGINFVRNQGIFWEPGILQLYLNILLFIELFYVKTSKYNILLTFILILTTFSTAGFLIFLMIIIYKFKSAITFEKIVILLPLAIIIGFILYPLIVMNFEDKFYGDHANSSMIRFFYTIQYLDMIVDFPFSGIGITMDPMNSLQYKEYNIIFNGNFVANPTGGTNSILKLILMFGIPVGMILLYALYRQSIFDKEKKLFFVILLIALSSEPIGMRILFVFLMINGLNSIISQKKIKGIA